MNESIIDRGIWVALSTGIAILAGVLYAYLEQKAQQSSPNSKTFDPDPWIVHSLRMIYAVSLPALALFTQGSLTYRGLGLKPFPWSATASIGDTPWRIWQLDAEATVTMILVTWVIFYLGFRSAGYRKAQSFHASSIKNALRESVINQVHWAFYRELFVYFMGIAVGSWLGIIPSLAEALLNPGTWTRLKNRHERTSLVFTSGLFIASLVLFIQTQNLWLMLLYEIATRLVFSGYGPVSGHASGQDTSV